MRYLDTGSRDANQALGAWLGAMTEDETVTALRWQSGFFGSDSLGYFVKLFNRLGHVDGVVRVLVGSNDGTTKRGDVELLLQLLGPPRAALSVGLVVFDNAYYHPKTFHFTRSDGSETAYVGSANLTRSGAASLHVEAGVTLDTRDGDASAVLASIRDAVDWWFESGAEGLNQLSQTSDLDELVDRRLLDVPRPPLTRQPVVPSEPVVPPGARLAPLLAIPAIPAIETQTPAGEPPAESGELTAEHAVVAPITPLVTTASWAKRLSQSDAQRKPQGNQRGSITLVAAGYPINAQSFFRYDFFGAEQWSLETTRTGEEREAAAVSFSVSVLGEELGVVVMPLTYAPNREASQANYTTLLHLGPLGPTFNAHDMTGREIRLERRTDRSFTLTIS